MKLIFFRLSSAQQSVHVLLTKEITLQKERHIFWLKVLYAYKACMKVAKDLNLLAKILVLPQKLSSVSFEEIPLLRNLVF